MRVIKGAISFAVLAVLLIALLAPAAVLAASTTTTTTPALPVLPTAFYGTVTFSNGTPAPVGTEVIATIEGALGQPGSGSITVTTAGQYGAPGLGSKLIVQTNNSSDVGGTIDFSVTVPSYTNVTVTATTYQAVYDKGVHQQNITLTGTYVPPTTTYYPPSGGGTTTTTTTATMATTTTSTTAITTTTTTPAPLITINQTNMPIDASGTTTADFTYTSPDGSVTLFIPKGTKFTDANGNPITSISMIVNLTPSQNGLQPGQYAIMGITCEPSGAQIAPPITLTFNYTDAQLAALGISANSLVVGYYDESGTLQQTFTPNIDTVNHKVTLQISHFSTWALIGSIVASTTTTTAPLPTSATTTTPAPPSSTATTIPPPAKGTNWGLIIGIIGGVVVIAIVIAVVVTRKKK